MWKTKNILQEINELSKEHPYKVQGDCETYSQYNEAWQDCIDRIKGIIMREMPDNDNGWTPVEPENLPEGEVLCCDKYGEMLIGWLSNTNLGYACESEECTMYDVVAWMEKPKPYKEDGE